MKVWMLPELQHFRSEESGIKRVVEAYHRHCPTFGVEFVSEGESYDLKVSHAGTNTEHVDVAMTHGLYWSADYAAAGWEYKANASVIETMRQARVITVPSAWVAESVIRDMRRIPVVVGHGIEWDEWQHDRPNGGYILWNKNRQGDVCDPSPLSDLATAFVHNHFVTTFAPRRRRTNISEIGVVPHEQMRQLVQGANVYLSTTKETFGIGVLEAMAAGVPVLGYAHGGNLDLVEHGTNGYLARPGDIGDLIDGLAYCLKHRDTLGANARHMVKPYTWEMACQKVAQVFEQALTRPEPTVAIIIPSYLYAAKVGRAIESAIEQTYDQIVDIIVVDDGSPDEGATATAVAEWGQRDRRVRYVHQNNQGVAVARNTGIEHTEATYICCLDADDAMEPELIERCVRAMELDNSLGVAYTGLRWVKQDGSTGVSPWPADWNFDNQLKKQNQVPTCCVFRREMWQALGGYKKRYCPIGAGAEDAEFWLRAGAYGWKGKKVTAEPLFIYSWMSGRVSGAQDYQEPDWLAWHPWVQDGKHPFASYATPQRLSHPVRQYDEPVVSVIIPVAGPRHVEPLEDALDSIEAQTFRRWETIVVWDSEQPAPQRLMDAYPFVKWRGIGRQEGAGAARNFGAMFARAPFLLFLDADDWLYPHAIERMLSEWDVQESIVYSDYVGKAFIEDPGGLSEKLQRNILWRQDDGLTAIRYEAPEYDVARAQRQPEGDPRSVFTWNLITSLVPKAWHDEVGGFDTHMVSWEDVDYWWRLAKAGKCFRRVPEPLVVYHFYLGQRRDIGTEQHENLFAYLREKHERIEIQMCGGCGGRKTAPVGAASPSRAIPSNAPVLNLAADEDFILCLYRHPNRGQHTLVGAAAFANRIEGLHMIATREGWKIHYGFRGGGEKFLVHREDIRLAQHLFDPIVERRPVAQEREPLPAPEPLAVEVAPAVPNETESHEPPPPPKMVDIDAILAGTHTDEAPINGGKFDPQKLAGVTATIAKGFAEQGIVSLEQVIAMGQEGLTGIRGVGEVRANMIYTAAMRMAQGVPDGA